MTSGKHWLFIHCDNCKVCRPSGGQSTFDHYLRKSTLDNKIVIYGHSVVNLNKTNQWGVDFIKICTQGTSLGSLTQALKVKSTNYFKNIS